MTGPITRHRDIESLKTAARWPGADRNTTVILATRLAAARADAEGCRYFSELADDRPGEALPLALADLEFVLAVRDQFPPMLIRAAYHGLATAYAVLGHDDRAAEAMRKSGLSVAPADAQLMFGGFWAAAAGGFRFTSPRILRPEPGIQVAQGYDFADLAFIATSAGVIAIDAGTTQDRGQSRARRS
jgi:hypothetical protein